MRRQCELLGLNRASYYYRAATETALNLELMRCIDEQYLKTPFYGRLRMTVHLQRLGYVVNHKRVQRLMQVIYFWHDHAGGRALHHAKAFLLHIDHAKMEGSDFESSVQSRPNQGERS